MTERASYRLEAERPESRSGPLQAEIQSPGELEQEDFQAQADYISMTVAKFPEHLAGLRAAHQEYVENEAHPELGRFGRLLVLAPRMAQEQGVLNELKAKQQGLRRQGQELSADESAQLEQSTRYACAYNQLLGSLVAQHEEAMPRRQMESWLTRASGHNVRWAGQVMAGVAAERAAQKLLEHVPGLTGLRHGDLDEDLRGQDLVFDRTPSGATAVDVKFVSHQVTAPLVYNAEADRLELNINAIHMDRNGYAVLEQFTEPYVQQLAQGLMRHENYDAR